MRRNRPDPLCAPRPRGSKRRRQFPSQENGRRSQRLRPRQRKGTQGRVQGPLLLQHQGPPSPVDSLHQRQSRFPLIQDLRNRGELKRHAGIEARYRIRRMGTQKTPVSRFRKTGALTWRQPTLTPELAGTTIGGGRLDARVRNGNGYFPSPMTTRCLPAERLSRVRFPPLPEPALCLYGKYSAPSLSGQSPVRKICSSKSEMTSNSTLKVN